MEEVQQTISEFLSVGLDAITVPTFIVLGKVTSTFFSTPIWGMDQEQKLEMKDNRDKKIIKGNELENK